MPAPLIPGWPQEQLEAHACLVLDRRGYVIYLSDPLGRLTDTPGVPLGTPPRPLQDLEDPAVQPAVENWVGFIVSGALTRMGIRSGDIALPRRSGGTVHCRWHYLGVPQDDPDYHLLFYEPLNPKASSPEPLARRALRMESALFEIQAIIDGVGLGQPPRELPDPVDLAALTERELDVMKLILDGGSNEAIARQLHVSVHTIKSHAQAIFRKLGVHSRADLMSRFVRSLGLVSSLVPLPSLLA